MRNSRNGAKLAKMSKSQQLEFMGTANRVTIGIINQVFDRELKRFYVAKVRGVIVSDGDTYRFDTKEEARKFGRGILDHWKRELAASCQDEGQEPINYLP